MSINYSVEKKVILTCQSESKMILEGWAITHDGNVPSFRVFVNGAEVESHLC